ncbi:MAG: hypothetical protein [Arizlama microvirus]|nr:MAG: hypothetical protein [Arizlama microvirus]
MPVVPPPKLNGDNESQYDLVDLATYMATALYEIGSYLSSIQNTLETIDYHIQEAKASVASDSFNVNVISGGE